MDRLDALALSRRLRDDLLLRWSDDRLLWITKWSDAKAADEFSDAYAKVASACTVEGEGDVLLISVGQVDDARGVARSLLRP